MASTPQSFRARREMNKALMCQACGKNHRVGISRICSACNNGLIYFGHPTARAIRLREINGWMVEAARLNRINTGHPALAAYSKWFVDWIRLSTEAPHAVPASNWVSNMTPEMAMDALKVFVGLYLAFHYARPWQMPDLRSLYFQMVKLLLQTFAPASPKTPLHWKRMSSAERKATALYLQRSVSPLLAGFKQALDAEEEARKQAHEVLATPLNFEKPPGV